jgi:hypothetical protein
MRFSEKTICAFGNRADTSPEISASPITPTPIKPIWYLLVENED